MRPSDEIPDRVFLKLRHANELWRLHRRKRPADLVRPKIKALCRQMDTIDGHFRLEAPACRNERVDVDNSCTMAGRYFPNDSIGRFDLWSEPGLGRQWDQSHDRFLMGFRECVHQKIEVPTDLFDARMIDQDVVGSCQEDDDAGLYSTARGTMNAT